MFKFIFLFLVIIQLDTAFAAPTTAKEINLGKLLAKVAKECENQFLSKQIINNIEKCDINIISQHLDNTQLKCLTFYEMSNRMCSEKTLIINDEMNENLNRKVSVSDICNSASAWNFTELSPLKNYKELFYNTSNCLNICKIEYIADDSSFFCKYYNWGYHLLENRLNPTPTEKPKIVLKVNDQNSENVSPKVENKVNDEINNKDGSNIPNKLEVIKETEATINEQISTSDSNVALNQTSKPVEKTEVKGEEVKLEPSPIGNEEVQIGKKGTNIDPNKTNPEINSQKQKDQQAPSLDKPNLPPSDTDMYDDPEDEDRIIGDNSDDGEDIPEIVKGEKKKNHLTDSYIRTEINDKNEEEVVFSKTPFKDIYPPGDQDQFMTYLVTAIVLIVLLYVLYHNKSKVTKVVLGLIVEGRQSGRRRNSRGHAYKRLDTLEQAISTTPARAPTKIIY